MILCLINNNFNNITLKAYMWGLDASGSMQGAGGVGGLLMVNAGSGGVHFPAYDLNGNVMGLVNATNGIISAKYEYGPFGEVFCSVGNMAKVNPFGFSTKYTDSETDLVYYGYRYYSPALGRWLSRDPIEERGGLNLYGFVNNDPVNMWDENGLFFTWEITGGNVDFDTVEKHDTGWIDDDDGLENAVFGAFKGLITFNVSSVLKIPKNAAIAAGAGAATENVCCKLQIRLTGVSVEIELWHGKITCSIFGKIRRIKYSHSDPARRILIELTRSDRIKCGERIIPLGTNIIPPYSDWDEWKKNISHFLKYNVEIK